MVLSGMRTVAAPARGRWKRHGIAEPFEAVELSVDVMFGILDDDGGQT